MTRRHAPDQMYLFDEVVPQLEGGSIIVDYFAGGGGASTGIEQALGRSPDIAINHCQHAVDVHTLNHPQTRHLRVDVWDVDPLCHLPVGTIDLAWFSPDCRHFSRAKGGTPIKKEVRGLAWIVLRVAAKRRPKVIVIENVAEFRDWCRVRKARWGKKKGKIRPIKGHKGRTFRRFIEQLEALGYVVEHRILNAADYGAPTARKRLVLIARRGGAPIVWPEPTHGPGRALPYRTAAECIDWSLPVQSIFGRKKPLAEATMARIAEGLWKFVLATPRPFVVANNTHNVPRSVDEPLSTITTGNRHMLVVPHLVQVNHGRDKNRSRSVQEPTPTITSKHGFALVVPYLVHQGNGERQGQAPRCYDAQEPLGTITAGGKHHGLAVAWLAKHNGKTTGQRLDEPMHTLVASKNKGLVVAFLAKFLGSRATDPVTVTIDGERYVVVDIGMRMLSNRELARCQGFDDSFQLIGTQAQQTACVGNSVPPALARAVVAVNFPREVKKAA